VAAQARRLNSNTDPGTTRRGIFAALDQDDREQQLQDQLLSDLSPPNLSAYVSALLPPRTPLLRAALGDRPAPDPITKTTSKDKGRSNVLGVVRDEQRRPVGRIATR